MTLLSKTLIIFFLLIYIGCVTYGPKKSIHDEGQSSGTKDEENNNTNKKVKYSESRENVEEEELLDEEFKSNLKLCEMELYVAFKHKDPFDNFCEGLLNLNGDNFIGVERYTELTQRYYYDLLDTLQKMNLPKVISPKMFCRIFYEIEADNCIRIIQNAGCDADADGVTCINQLYYTWKKRKEYTSTPIPGTENLSDKMLLEAIFSGYKNPYKITDEDLFQEYNNTHIYQQISEEEINDIYQTYQSRGGNLYDFETFRESILQADRQYYEDYGLHDARFQRYGVRTASYTDICREYVRRENSPKIYYDNYYVNYLINEIKNNDCSKFKDRTKFCKEYLKKNRSQQQGSQKNIMY